MKIINLECTCGACPTQYEGKLEDGRMFYFRYRWGYASLSVSPKESNDVYDAVSGEEVYGEQLSDEWDGVLEEAKVIEILDKVFGPVELITQIKI